MCFVFSGCFFFKLRQRLLNGIQIKLPGSLTLLIVRWCDVFVWTTKKIARCLVLSMSKTPNATSTHTHIHTLAHVHTLIRASISKTERFTISFSRLQSVFACENHRSVGVCVCVCGFVYSRTSFRQSGFSSIHTNDRPNTFKYRTIIYS